MKKLQFSLIAASALMLASCSADELFENGAPVGNTDGKVTFKVNMPGGIGSRAIADGLSAIDLTYAVYDAEDNDKFLFQETEASVFSGKLATVEIPLVNGKSYKVAFFAKNGAAPYTITDGVLTADYSSAVANSDIYDGFYKLEELTVTAGMPEKTVTLTRPFAQINVGATDWAAAKRAGYVVSNTGLSFTANVCTTLNLLTGVTSDLQTVTFGLNDLPDADTSTGDLVTSKLTVSSVDYDYMAMAYVLMPQSTDPGTISTVTFSYTGPDKNYDIAVNSVPALSNHRTNIVGKFFTTNVTYNIIIDEQFDDPDITHMTAVYNGVSYSIDPTPWDGVASAEPYTDPVTGERIICSAAQLAGAAKLVNEISPASRASNPTANQNFVLLTDVDLAGHNWTPIGAFNPGDLGNDSGFAGTFSGMGHKISNLSIEYGLVPNAQKAGLFGKFGGSKTKENDEFIKDLTLDGVIIKGCTKAQGDKEYVGVGALVGYAIPGCVIENVKVLNADIEGNRMVGGIVGAGYVTIKNCVVDGFTITCVPNQLADGTYDNGDKVGGIIGQVTEEAHNLEGNTAMNGTIKAYRDLGGIVGNFNTTKGKMLNNTVKNVDIIATSPNNYSDHIVGENAAAIVGRPVNKSFVLDSSNTAVNVTISAQYNVSSQAEFKQVWNAITAKDVVINLGEGLYTFDGGKSNPLSNTFGTGQGEHEAMDAVRYTNITEDMNIVINGKGKDKTAFSLSDGNLNIGNKVSVSALINGAKITFNNMLQIRRYYTILDATSETYNNCEIWGGFNPMSYELNFNNCEFYTTPRSTSIAGVTSVAAPGSTVAVFFGGYARFMNFDNCRFETLEPKAIQIYSSMRHDVRCDITAKDCILYGGTQPKTGLRAFFEVHGELGNHGTMTLTNCAIDAAYTSNWGGGLWTNNFSWEADNYTVIVDGTQVATSSWTGTDNAWIRL